MTHGMGWRKQRLDHRDKIYRMQIPRGIRVDESKDYDCAKYNQMHFPIYDQGQTSSCVGNAVARDIEYLFNWEGLENFAASRLFIYWNGRAAIHETDVDGGCEIRDAINSVAKLGVPPESEWPFIDSLIRTEPPHKVFADAVRHVALVYQSVPQDLQHILNCFRQRLPVVFGTNVFDSWDNPNDGVIPMPGPGDKPLGGHAILLTGWDATNKRFHFVNSWGADWGKDGYGSLPAEYVLDGDMSSDFWALFLMKK